MIDPSISTISLNTHQYLFCVPGRSVPLHFFVPKQKDYRSSFAMLVGESLETMLNGIKTKAAIVNLSGNIIGYNLVSDYKHHYDRWNDTIIMFCTSRNNNGDNLDIEYVSARFLFIIETVSVTKQKNEVNEELSTNYNDFLSLKYDNYLSSNKPVDWIELLLKK